MMVSFDWMEQLNRRMSPLIEYDRILREYGPNPEAREALEKVRKQFEPLQEPAKQLLRAWDRAIEQIWGSREAYENWLEEVVKKLKEQEEQENS